MYKAARDVHTNGIHNTYTSKGRGKMNHIKQFFREKGLYLFCLAMVFAATACVQAESFCSASLREEIE